MEDKDWKFTVNKGNLPVLSARTHVDPVGGMVHYSSVALRPYIGRPFWVLEQPKWVDDTARNEIESWSEVLGDPNYVFKTIKNDHGLYRVRCTLEVSPYIINPDAVTFVDTFAWDFAGLRRVLSSSGGRFFVEQAVEGHRTWSWVTQPNPNWKSGVDVYRLRTVPQEGA